MNPSPGSGGPDILYSLRQVARLTGIRPEQLRRWDKSGLLPTCAHEDGQRGYRFPDVMAARAAASLLGQGHTTRAVREAVQAVRAWRSDPAHPLASLRIYTDSGRLVVRLDDTLVEPRSGQLVLDLPLETLTRELLGQLVTVDPRKAEAEVSAEEWVQRGLDAEAEGLDPAVAERRYRKALERDAGHPGARVNLGNLLYTQGRLDEAKGEYRLAIEAAPGYADAWYNLANTLDDQGTPDAAVSAYEEALRLEPDFADAHFNLGLLWEKQGQRSRARACWCQFLTLAPDGASAAIARRFEVAVTWGDCDAAGIVFYPNYFKWFDAAAHAFFARIGFPHRELATRFNAIGLILLDARASFRAPATYGETLTVITAVAERTTKVLTLSHRIVRGDTLICEGQEVRIFAIAGPRSAPIPAELAEKLS